MSWGGTENGVPFQSLKCLVIHSIPYNRTTVDFRHIRLAI